MSRIQAGPFSDGGLRLRTVQAGYSADPAPSDASKIIFDSDWGELFPTDAAHIGVATIGVSSSWQTIAFPALGYVPFALIAYSGTGSNNSMPAGEWFFPQIVTGTGGSALGPVVEIFADHIAILYNPTNPLGPQIKVAWCVVRSSTAVSSVNASRAGTNWMRWTNAGPLIAKPGKSVTSTNQDDFLIKAGAGIVNGQPLASNVVTSVPYVGASRVYTSGSYYALTIPYNLGYVPLCWAQLQTAFSGLQVSIDTANLNISYDTNFVYSGNPPLTIYPLYYSILRQQWF